MAPSVILTTARSSEPLQQADPEVMRHLSQRHDALRRGVIATVALALATLLVGLSYVVGAHMLAAWWLERLNGTVLWNIDETNWQQGGMTSVSIVPRSSQLSNADLKIRGITQ